MPGWLGGGGWEVGGAAAAGSVIGGAGGAGGGPRYRQVDVREARLPDGHYDFISCIASLHHMPFETVLTLRRALAPGGVLVVLGLYPVRTVTDFVWAFPALSLLRADRMLSRRRAAPSVQVPMVWPPPLSYARTRAESARLLPGSTLRRLLFWRYLLVYRA